MNWGMHARQTNMQMVPQAVAKVRLGLISCHGVSLNTFLLLMYIQFVQKDSLCSVGECLWMNDSNGMLVACVS